MEPELTVHPLSDREGLRLREVAVRFLRWLRAKDIDDLAGETLLRLIQNLRAGENVSNLDAYVRQVARNVRREQFREMHRQAELERNLHMAVPGATGEDAEALSERLNRCKKCCLTSEEAALIEAYYGGDPDRKIARRKELAIRQGLNDNALRLRVFRVRRKLYDCMQSCAQPENERNPSASPSLSIERSPRAR